PDTDLLILVFVRGSAFQAGKEVFIKNGVFLFTAAACGNENAVLPAHGLEHAAAGGSAAHDDRPCGIQGVDQIHIVLTDKVRPEDVQLVIGVKAAVPYKKKEKSVLRLELSLELPKRLLDRGFLRVFARQQNHAIPLK